MLTLPSFCISLRASSSTRSNTQSRIFGDRTLVIAPSVTSATMSWISTSSVLAYLTAARHSSTSTRTPRSLIRSLTW